MTIKDTPNTSANTDRKQTDRQELSDAGSYGEGHRKVEICRGFSRGRHAVLQTLLSPMPHARVRHIDAAKRWQCPA